MIVLPLPTVFVILAREKLAWPVQRYWRAYLAAPGTIIDLQLFFVFVMVLGDPGDSAPLVYIPTLNPLLYPDDHQPRRQPILSDHDQIYDRLARPATLATHKRHLGIGGIRAGNDRRRSGRASLGQGALE